MQRLVCLCAGLLCMVLASTAGAAWEFDAGDTVTMADAAVMTLPNGTWSLAGWVKVHDTSEENRTVFTWGTAGTANYLHLYVCESDESLANRLRWYYYGTNKAVKTILSATQITASADWVHVVILRDSGDDMRMYINGVQEGSTIDLTYGYSCNAATAWTWGGTYWDGDIAEWACWNDQALGSTQIAALAAGGEPESQAGYTPDWHCDMYDAFDCQIGGLEITNVGSGAEAGPFDHPVTRAGLAPYAATNPFPATTGTGAGYDPAVLRWVDPHGGATSFTVYCDTSNPPTTEVYAGSNTYTTVADLAPNTTYYWRVDSTNATGTTTGTVWSFTTWNWPVGTKKFAGPAATGLEDGSDEDNLLAWSSVAGSTSEGDLVFIVGGDATIFEPDDTWPAGRLYYARYVTANDNDIRWTLDRYYRIGQFADGQIWVDGPASITSIYPAWDAATGRHGTMVNPAQTSYTGWNGQTAWDANSIDPTTYSAYNHAYNVLDESILAWPTHGLPMTFSATSSILSSECRTSAYEKRQWLKSIGVLTVVDTPCSEGDFRPPVYGDSSKTVAHNISEINWSLLGSVAATATKPTVHTASYTDRDDWNETLERSCERIEVYWIGSELKSQSNMPRTHRWYYPMECASQRGREMLVLNCSDWTQEQKSLLMYRVIQQGLDAYACRAADAIHFRGEGFGGSQMATVLFAGTMLEDAAMVATLADDYDDERGQYFYVAESDVYGVSYTSYTLNKAGAFTRSTGTVTVTNGSPIVTLNSGTWASPGAEVCFFGVVGDNRAYDPRARVYEILSYDSTTQITLTEDYDGETNPAASYKWGDAVWYGHGKPTKMDAPGENNESDGEVYFDYYEYTTPMIGLPEFGTFYQTQPEIAGPMWGYPGPGRAGTYRWSMTEGNGGIAMTILIMGLEAEWDGGLARHCGNAYIQYLDRHAEYTQYLLQFTPTYPASNDWFYSTFEREMYYEYRDDYVSVLPIWTAKASNPSPASGTTGLSSPPTLTWSAGAGIDQWDVKMKTATTDWEEVASGLNSTSFDTSTLSPELSADTIYYWVVEANMPDPYERVYETDHASAYQPSVWNFTLGTQDPPIAPINLSPANGATGVAIDVTMAWENGGGPGTYDVYFEAADETPDVLVLENTELLAYDPAVDLDYETTYYWKVVKADAQSSAVHSFTTVAETVSVGQITSPSPADDATWVSITPTLSWTAGSNADWHIVYMSTSKEEVTTPSQPETYRTEGAANSYAPGRLQYDTGYYWRVDEKNMTSGDVTTGAVLYFRTRPAPVVLILAG